MLWHVQLVKNGPYCIRQGLLNIAYVWGDTGEVLPANTEGIQELPARDGTRWIARQQPAEYGWLADFRGGSQP